MSISRPHRRPLTTATVHDYGETSLMVTFTRGCLARTPLLARRGSLPPSSHHTIFRWNVPALMTGPMIAPSARMMSLYSYTRQKLRKLRFLMTDNNGAPYGVRVNIQGLCNRADFPVLGIEVAANLYAGLRADHRSHLRRGVRGNGSTKRPGRPQIEQRSHRLSC